MGPLVSLANINGKSIECYILEEFDIYINFPRNLKEVVREPKEFEEIQSEETGWRPTGGSVAWSESIRGWRVRVYMWLEFEWLAGVMEACLFFNIFFNLQM